MIDALLVRPPSELHMSNVLKKKLEVLGLGYLAAALRRNGYRVEILDAYLKELDVKGTVAEIRRKKSKLVGFSVWYQMLIPETLRIIEDLRADGVTAHITLGGHFPTFAYRELLSEVPGLDTIVVGEGEYTLLELMQKVETPIEWKNIQGIACREGNKVIAASPRPLIADLDSLAWPDRDTLPDVLKAGGALSVCSSRGCYGQCTFCTVHSFYRLQPGMIWRARTPRDVVDEIEALVEKWRVREIWFVDDNFIVPGKVGRRRAYGIAEEILRRRLDIAFRICCRPCDVDKQLFSKLKRAGLKGVLMGVESGVQRALDTFKKGITVDENIRAITTVSNLDLSLNMGFILLDPYTTIEEIEENLRFLQRWGLKNVHPTCNRLYVFRGVPIEETLRQKKRLQGSYMDFGYTIADPRIEVFSLIAGECINWLRPLIERVMELEVNNRNLGSSVADTVWDKEAIEKLIEDINSTHIRFMKEILQRVKKEKEDPSEEVDKLTKEVCDRVSAYSREMLAVIGVAELISERGMFTEEHYGKKNVTEKRRSAR